MVLLLLTAIFCPFGFFTLQPNEAAVLLLFGAYKGTVRESGFCFTNPLNKRHKISRRARNLNGDKLKVNDKRGNPIEIAAVVVWRVQDTAQAVFDVDNYENYVRVQSESAVRHVASSYAYDNGELNELTLRGGSDEVSAALTRELQDRLAKAGVQVEEARLTHLAYAPEIAQAMLRRQQAEAVIAARQRKSFLLRVDPELWAELEHWAADELRSVNGQVEYLLRQAVQKRKRTQAAEDSGDAGSKR